MRKGFGTSSHPWVPGAVHRWICSKFISVLVLVVVVVVVNDPMDDRMLGRTAHRLGWWLLRTHDAQEVQQRRQGWEELGEEGNKSQSEVKETESVWEKEKIW